MKIHFMQLVVILMTVANLFTPIEADLTVHVSPCDEPSDLSPSRTKTKGRLTTKSKEQDAIQDFDHDQYFEIKDLQGHYVAYFFPVK